MPTKEEVFVRALQLTCGQLCKLASGMAQLKGGTALKPSRFFTWHNTSCCTSGQLSDARTGPDCSSCFRSL